MSGRSNNDQQSPSRQQQKAQLCDLYLDIRTKLDEGSAIYLRRIMPLDDDQNTVFNTEYQAILQYIKQIVTHLIVAKEELEQIIEQKNQNECSDYETCLQKLEAEVRQHIRLKSKLKQTIFNLINQIEQQLKLYAETTQEKLEQVSKEKEDMEEKFKGINLDQMKQIEKSHSQAIDQLKKKDEEYQQMQQQYKQKSELAESQEETIKQLRSQISQMQLSQQQSQSHLSNSQWLQQQQIPQLQFNAHLVSGDSSQSSKMVSVNPNQQSSQQNLNDLSYIEAKRGKRSVSSMNEDTIKKYTQFSQSSQINPQQILSANSQISYNTQNKIPQVNLNSDQINDQQNTRMYTDPHVQERSSSRIGNTVDMKENRKSFDKYASSIQEKLMKKDGQNTYYYNENNNNNNSGSSNNNNNNSYKNIQQQPNNLMNSKLTTTATSTLTSVQQNPRLNQGQIGVQKQLQQQTIMPTVGTSNNNNSSLLINSKQKGVQQQPIAQISQNSGYLNTSGIQHANQLSYQAQLHPAQVTAVQHSSGQQQQPGLASGSRIKYTHQQNNSLSGISQTSTLQQTNSINGSNGGVGSYQYDGSYQTLDSQRNKQNLANKLNEIQNCLSSRQQNSGQQQPVQPQPYQTTSHLRNSSNQSIINPGDKSNILNNSYTLQHYQQQQHNQSQINQGSVPSTSQLNSSNIKYSPATHQVSISNTQQIQQNQDLNKSQRSFMNASGNNNNNISMNQYNSKEQNGSNININSSAINGQNSSNHQSSHFKNSTQLSNQSNSNHLTGNAKYGQYIQSQRPNSSFEKSNPYIQNSQQQQYKPQQGIAGMTNPQQNVGVQNNGQLSYQQVGHHNPRSQSMDGFQKQQQQANLSKPGNTNQTQNAYLKQKTASQMQTVEAINNMIKNFKMN